MSAQDPLNVWPRRVVCAAIRCPNGRVIIGVRHMDAFMREQLQVHGEDLTTWTEMGDGFVDNFGVFMTREEARELADANGQVIHETPRPDILFSENLY